MEKWLNPGHILKTKLTNSAYTWGCQEGGEDLGVGVDVGKEKSQVQLQGFWPEQPE